MQELAVITNIAQTIADYKLKWANVGLTCDSTCLDSTGASLAALNSHENLSASSVKNWLWLKTKQVFLEQYSVCGTASTDNLTTENAYMFFDFDEKFWPYLDKSSSDITALFQAARSVSKIPKYKDFYLQASINGKLQYDYTDLTKSYVYDDFLNGSTTLR